MTPPKSLLRETHTAWFSRKRSVNSYLLLLVLACLIPGVIGGIALIWQSNRSSQQALERASIRTARALIDVVDGQLAQSRTILQALVSYDGVQKRDFSALYQRTLKIVATTELAHRFSVTDKLGQLIFNTSRPFGEPLPKHGNPEHIQGIIESRKSGISNLFTGAINHDLIVTVDMPILIDNEVEFVLTSALRPPLFTRLLENQGLPPGWITAILDREGNFVTRVPAIENFTGSQRNEKLFSAIREASEGALESTAIDGTPILAVHARSPVSGWTVVLGIPLESLQAAYKRQFYILLAGVSGLLIISVSLAAWMSRRISDAIRALVEPARKLGLGQTVVPVSAHIKEADEVAHALVDAATLLNQRTEALEAERSTRLTQLEQLVAERTLALEAATREAQRLARRDALTGLLNRLAAHERLQEEFQRAKRSGEAYAALLLDIDHFKQVNDTYGHEAGDRVLEMTADLLTRSVRSTDFIFRFGGEEFLIILPETTREGAAVIAEKIRAEIEAHQFAGWLRLTASIGLSVSSANDVNDHDVVRRADSALYIAKNEGRNGVRCC